VTWVIRFILFTILLTLVARSVMRLFGGIVEGASGEPRKKVAPGTKMVKDPVCGTYVVPARALTASKKSGETAWFCSPECREAWQRR
jgi:YHS domain-containing protein